MSDALHPEDACSAASSAHDDVVPSSAPALLPAPDDACPVLTAFPPPLLSPLRTRSPHSAQNAPTPHLSPRYTFLHIEGVLRRRRT